METEYGYHLMLVSERTNCPKLDGENTFILQTRGDDVFGTLYEGKQVGKVNLPDFVMDQVQFWTLTVVAGGRLKSSFVYCCRAWFIWTKPVVIRISI